MNDLTLINHNGVWVADSREVAGMTEKEHKHLMRDIKGYVGIVDPSPTLDSANFFIPSTYIDAQNQERPCYLLTRKGCDMVANKMTGEKGVLFTAMYVTRFEEMERKLSTPKQAISNDAKMLRNEAMLINAKTRQAKVLKDFAHDYETILSPVSIQLLVAEAVEVLVGKPLLPLPQIEKMYTATEIGKELGVSAYLVGRAANKFGLKTEKYGVTVLDIAPNGKQVPSFRYNEDGKHEITEILRLMPEGGKKWN